MKVQLLQPVNHLGLAGDIIEVSDAQARNQLLPKKLAVTATAAVLAARQQDQAHHYRQQERRQRKLAELLQRLAGMTVHLTGKANPQGKLFAAVKTIDLQAELERLGHLRLPDLRSEPDHLKTLGTHQVNIIIGGTHRATLHVVIDHAE